MLRLIEIARTGLVALLLHPLRSIVTIASAVVILVPYLVGMGISRGIEREAQASLEFGGDLYVTGNRFGRTAPIPAEAAGRIRALDGVRDVVPRIVGRIDLGRDRHSVIVVGIPLQRMPESLDVVRGRLPAAAKLNEVVIGTELAQRLHLDVGAMIPPFYRSSRGERVTKVVGVFRARGSLWQSHLMLTPLSTAAEIFDQPGWITDLVVRCRPGRSGDVRAAILETVEFASAAAPQPQLRPRVVTREELEALLPRGVLHREGIFNLHFVLLFVVAILVVLVTSGFGLAGRRREIGILKACGWQTDEVLLRSLVEGFLLSLTAASVSVLISFIWLRWFNGYGIAAILLSGAGVAPSFQVPFQLSAFSALLALLIALVVVNIGSLYSSWSAAVADPVDAMR